jgi:hypothetical protein
METGTLSSRACTLPSNVYSMAYMLQYLLQNKIDVYRQNYTSHLDGMEDYTV